MKPDWLIVEDLLTGRRRGAEVAPADRDEAIRQLAAADLPDSAIAARLSINHVTVRRALRKRDEQQERAARAARFVG